MVHCFFLLYHTIPTYQKIARQDADSHLVGKLEQGTEIGKVKFGNWFQSKCQANVDHIGVA